MIQHVQNDRSPEKTEVLKQGLLSHVWLRENITSSTETREGVEVTTYEYDEAYLTTTDQVTAAEVEADFSTWWAKADVKTDSEKIEVLEARQDETDNALIELAEIIAGGE